MTEPDEVVVLRLPAHARYIRLARLVGAGLADDLGLDLDGLDDVRLAIGEACGLATQFGVTSLDVDFRLDDGRLTVRGDGHAGTPPASAPGGPADDEQLRLVRQILDIACAEHELTLHEAGLSFSLTFTHAT